MYISCGAPLPYIEISNPRLKLLIDTGSSKSLLKPFIAEKYYPETIFHSEVNIKTAFATNKIKNQAIIPAFKEFNSSHKINFVLFDFHEYYDGILGLEDLLSMNLNLDLTNRRLINNFVTIPLKFRNPEDDEHVLTIEGKQRILKRIPVSVPDGDILLNETSLSHNVYIPSMLTTSINGYATVEIINTNEQTVETKINKPIKAQPFPKSVYEIYNLNFTQPSKQYTNKPEINKLVRTDHLNDEERKQLIQVCEKYVDIFQTEDKPLTFTSNAKHEIKTSDEIPIHTKSYRYPYIHKTEVQKQIKEMLDKNIIRPSSSPWSAPIWIVEKKLDASGKKKWRLVIDYRKLNDKTTPDRYPIPNVTDILDKLGRSQYFSVLDLASGFHQIEIHPNSIKKTAFSVDNGHYEFLRMPFGLKNAPSTFQRVMDEVLKDLQNKICMVYMDDIIIFSTSLQEHIQNLKLVFNKLREAQLRIQLDKCEFLRKEVQFLGHVVTPAGIKPNPAKILAIQNFPIPKTQKEIKSFLGLLGYYRKFINNFAKITKPLTNCLKKNKKIIHDDEFKNCFILCKNLLTSEPVLAYPDFSKPFELVTDASNYAIGCVLQQNGHPISYASRTLNPAETNYSTIEKELLAIVFGCKYHECYLFGKTFTIKSDHKPLQWLFNLKEPNSRLLRWRLKLEKFDFNVEYTKGKDNKAADALSRIQNTHELNALETDSVIVNVDETEEALEDLNEETETVHTAIENPILSIPITDRALNTYKNQLVITSGEIKKTIRNTTNIFNNERQLITLPNSDMAQAIIQLAKDYFKPKTTYAIYFRNPEIAKLFTTTLQQTFKHDAFQIIQCTKFAEDVTSEEEQLQKIGYYHNYKKGHRGMNELKTSLSNNYYWPNMNDDIIKYIDKCETCNKNKYDRHPPPIKFSLTPTAMKPFEHVHIDIFRIGSSPHLTILDAFSRYGQAYALPNITGTSVISALITFFTHHGLPLKITTDCGTEFKNYDLSDFCKLHKIELHYTSSKNSTSNAPVERFHSTLAEHIRCIKEDKKTLSTDQVIKYALLCYNNSIHSVTKYTPFEIIKGHINNTDPFDLTETRIISNYVQHHKDITKDLYANIHRKNSETKQNQIDKINKKRIDPPDFNNQQVAYIRTKARLKQAPKYRQFNVVKDNGKYLKTSHGLYHKRLARRPKPKRNKANLLQVPQDERIKHNSAHSSLQQPPDRTE